MVDRCIIIVRLGKSDTSDTSPMMMENPANVSTWRDKSIKQDTAPHQLSPPPDAIELSGLELLGIRRGCDVDDDPEDDVSCESYCADSVPCALRNKTSTIKESSNIAMKSCRRPATSRNMPAIILRRGSLASQLTDEEEDDDDDDDEASEASLESSESSHSIDLSFYANRVHQQHRVPTTQRNKRSHLQRLHSSASAPFHGSGYNLTADDVSENHFVDFANDSIHLFATSTTRKQNAVRTFAPAIAPAPPARQPQSAMGRAA
jgi:hypothetical protein